MIHDLLRAAPAVALTALSLALAGPAAAAGTSAPSPAGPCTAVTAPLGYACVPAPKQCVTTPCPQYDLVALAPGPWPDVRA